MMKTPFGISKSRFYLDHEILHKTSGPSAVDDDQREPASNSVIRTQVST